MQRARKASLVALMLSVPLGSALVTPSANNTAQEGSPVSTGPYLGQAPPTERPELFAPGIVSTAAGNHSSVAFSPDGRELFWESTGKIWSSRLDDGGWTKPAMLPFCVDDAHQDGNPFVSPGGDRILFTSLRPGAASREKEAIWFAERTSEGWSEPEPIGPEVNEMPLHWSISVSESGTLFFQHQCSEDECEGGVGDIYYSRLVDGRYTSPVRMGPEINTPDIETCPFVAPDESYLLFNRFVPEDMKRSGIYISYRDDAGAWMPAMFVLGGSRDRGGMNPVVSPDGMYLFYARGDEGVWWQGASFIEEMRPEQQGIR